MQKQQADQNSQSDQVYQQEQEYSSNLEQGELEKNFLGECSELNISQRQQVMQQGGRSAKCFEMSVPKAIEMMFILYSFCQDDLVNVGINYGCRVKTTLNRIRIQSDSSEKDLQSCYKKMQQYLKKLIYTQIHHDNKFKIFYSPYFKKKSLQKDFQLCKFNGKIYAYTLKLDEKTLQARLKDLVSSQMIFTVDIKSFKSRNREIYTHLREFVKKMIGQFGEEVRTREVFVEIDQSLCRVNCIGGKARDLVAVKNMFKNLLESTVIFIAKYEPQIDNLDEKVNQVKLFVKKNVNFPVHVARVQKRIIALISKQNILRKLIQKKKIIETLQLYTNCQLGIFLPRRYNYLQRKIMIEEMCVQKGYDFANLGGVYHFFKKMFLHQGQVVDPKQLPSLINQVFQIIKQNKQRFQIPQHIKNIKRQKKEIQVVTGEYYSTSQIDLDQQLSRKLKYQVLKQKLKMSKPAFIKYKIFQGNESGNVYWFLNNQQKVECQVQDMKRGTEYFCGKYKQNGQEKVYFFQFKIKII